MRHKNDLSLAEKTAEQLFEIIANGENFKLGDKLPNENELSLMLKVSRGTLREAVRILITRGILEINRGKGTFVSKTADLNRDFGLHSITETKMGLKDLMEIRLIFEPEAAYYAAKRATDKELEQILYYGNLTEEKLLSCQDRTEEEQLFHNAISRATHNEFMGKLMPLVNTAIYKGVLLSKKIDTINQKTLHDHRAIMEFIEKRDALGAKTAMKMHILNAANSFGLDFKED